MKNDLKRILVLLGGKNWDQTADAALGKSK
jgi:hypothetical protein